MHAALPMNQVPQMQTNPLASSWAADFMQHQPAMQAPIAQQPLLAKANMDLQVDANARHASPGFGAQGV